MDATDRLLNSTAKAARRLDVSRWTIQRWIKQGKLRAFTIPGTSVVRITTTELERFVREETVPFVGKGA